MEYSYTIVFGKEMFCCCLLALMLLCSRASLANKGSLPEHNKLNKYNI
jgi:hypothetical protein